MCEVRKWLKFLTLNGCWSWGGEIFIVKWQAYRGLNLCTTESNRRKNDSKVKVINSDLSHF